MYQVKILSHFAAAHALRGYQGECEQLHGHNWHVEVVAQSQNIDAKSGLLLDFKVLKKITHTVTQKLDHQYLNEIPPFTTINPTAENIARYLYESIESLMEQPHILYSVTVWETQNACATYKKDHELT